MFFMPSYGRPNCFERLLAAPGGMPEMTVVVNADDPTREEYLKNSPWPVIFCPAGSRCVTAWNWVFSQYPDLDWYGMFSDDMVPETPGWWQRMIDAAGKRYLAFPNAREGTEFPLMRNTSVNGGDLTRVLGWLCAPIFSHNYADCLIDVLLTDTDLKKPLADVFVSHLHWKWAGVGQDRTYARNQEQHDRDAAIYYGWLGSQDRIDVTNKLRAWKASWEPSG